KTTIDAKTLNGINVQKNRTQNALIGCLSGYAMDTSTDGCITSMNDLYVDIPILYPNPVRTEQIFQIKAERDFEMISIFDPTGKLVSSFNYSNASVANIQAPKLTGSYIMIVSFGNFHGVYKLLAL